MLHFLLTHLFFHFSYSLPLSLVLSIILHMLYSSSIKKNMFSSYFSLFQGLPFTSFFFYSLLWSFSLTSSLSCGLSFHLKVIWWSWTRQGRKLRTWRRWRWEDIHAKLTIRHCECDCSTPQRWKLNNIPQNLPLPNKITNFQSW